MVQRLRLIAVTVLSILALTIIGATLPSPAYACSRTSSLSSSTITVGTSSVSVTGTDTCNPYPGSSADHSVVLRSGACPGVVPYIWTTNVATDSSGNFIQSIPTSSLSPGSYCVIVVIIGIPDSFDPLMVTSAASIPEYPFGLAVLAIFMVLGYGVIKRRTLTKQK